MASRRTCLSLKASLAIGIQMLVFSKPTAITGPMSMMLRPEARKCTAPTSMAMLVIASQLTMSVVTFEVMDVRRVSPAGTHSADRKRVGGQMAAEGLDEEKVYAHRVTGVLPILGIGGIIGYIEKGRL